MNRLLWKSALLCSVLLGGSVSASYAQNATTGGDQQPQADAQTRRGPGRQGERRGGGTHGTVTAVNGSNVTLKTDTGKTWTVISTDNTRVRRDGQPGTVSGIQTGDEVVAMGIPDADKHEVHAMMLIDVSAAEVAKAKANLGKTYIIGRITAINDTQLTILRSDKVSQVITLDESTSLHRGGRMNAQALAAAGLDTGMMGGGMGMGGGGRRGGGANANAGQNDAGEAITLADVKVGENVAGTGSMKGNSFVPTDLHVVERRIGGERRGPDGAADQPPR
ncbi:MAG: DUF5666 domain-containing protein [Janthinobacterium lividum]